MGGRSPKVRPSLSPSALREPLGGGGLTSAKPGGPCGYLGPRGAVSAGGVAILSGRAQGPEPGPPRPAFLPGPLSRCKMRGLQRAARRSVWSGPGNSGAAPRPGCEPLRPLSFKSPPGTGNRGDAGEMRPRPAIPASTPPARPRPGRTNIPCTPRPAARSSVPRDPSPLHAPPCTAFLLELAMERTQTRKWRGSLHLSVP
ncbi:collagen alpha-1(I) chain-like isoform X2 [Ursus maritimus]|uniref:Collagen alpha-1(I) chain-like isoform X2 n=1 Tax=Ursus maritimus TaxID=29073 RepID=A0A8M1GYS8_URSMA|nr:collagen alpha-1(I) chain-like isoform X2 [Ursus maritimus]